MAKLIITVEGGKFTQTLNFLDRNIKDNRYIYENGNESGIMEDPMELYEDIPECSRIAEQYEELLEVLDLGKSQLTSIMRQLNTLEKTMDPYVIPKSNKKQEILSVSCAVQLNRRKLNGQRTKQLQRYGIPHDF